MEQKGLDFGPAAPRPAPGRRTFTVSQLTERIQGALETGFADVWVEGEVSNWKAADSGHWYFSLKDGSAQVRVVVWRTQARLIRFRPADGMKVLVRGSVRVYPPRGEYQLSVELIEPLGKGSLQQAFEELKERLGKEGLFEAARKRPLPMLPRRIGVVTSPTGAAIQDLLHVLRARYSNLEVLIYAARVQGPEAAWEIVQGIRALNGVAGLDVLIVARGGGSLEDLWPFNEESVARALASSTVPTISAVGHETDFTIADFVADLRAPTPSAAAERVVKAKIDLEARLAALDKQLRSGLSLRLARVRNRVQALTSHRVFEAERRRLRIHAQRVDELLHLGERGLRRRVERTRERWRRSAQGIEAFRWDRLIAARREGVARRQQRLVDLSNADLDARRASLGRLAGKLDSLSPLAVLSRGYALVWNARNERLLRTPGEVRVGDALRIRLHGGSLGAEVTSKEEE